MQPGGGEVWISARRRRPGRVVFDFDGAGDQHFALGRAAAAAANRIGLGPQRDLGLVDLDKASERRAARRDHGAAQLGAQQPRGLVGTEPELLLQLQRRNPIRMGGHEIGGPEPCDQRQLRTMHDCAGRGRGLLAAGGAFPSPRLGLQRPRFAVAAAGADEPLRPARREQVFDARRLIREALLELDQGAGEVGHLRHRGHMFVICSIINPLPHLQHFVAPDAEG